ncbi:MAG: AAA family ATPase [bacterium]|nr:AAA family ATPase [bacterium]
MSTPSLATLFEESCDPHAYIPRRASEEVLRCLAALIRDGEPALVLHGPSGIGKTMLLHVLAERFEDERRVAYISLTDAPAPELTHRVLDALAEPATDDPAGALIATAAAASEGQPRLLLLIDHANLAPVASSLQLVSAAGAASPHLTIIFAVADEEGAEEFARAISAQARVTTLCFSQSMDPEEASAYVRLRLARTEVPAALREQLDDRAMAWLSEGAQATLPREINRRAAELLRSFEEDGEAALQISIEGPEPPPTSTTPPGPRKIEPRDIPGGDPVEPNPPSFPMSPGGAEPGASPGGGSLGGMLLGHGPGPKPNFQIDLELGRSLSSGLLESQAPKKPTRDGQPVSSPPKPEDKAEGAEEAPHHHPSTETNRPVLAVVASITTLLLIGGYLAMWSNVQTDPVEPAPAAKLEPPQPSVPDPEPVTQAAVEPKPAPTKPEARPSLADGPMLAPILARKAEQEKSAPTVEPKPRAPAPAARRTPAPQTAKGPIILQSGDSAELTHPGSYVRLIIDVAPGAKILVDGKLIGRAPFDEIMVEMGLHTFAAEMQDGIIVEQLVDVQSGTDVVEF